LAVILSFSILFEPWFSSLISGQLILLPSIPTVSREGSVSHFLNPQKFSFLLLTSSCQASVHILPFPHSTYSFRLWYDGWEVSITWRSKKGGWDAINLV
jgi:hypothetical protein